MQAAEAAEYCSAMASSVNAALVFMMILGYTGSLIVDLGYAQSGLNPRFYISTCPNVVQIVATVVSRHLKKDAGMGAPLVRMFFHDCFVEGCDASVLLMSPNRTAERDAVPNLTLSQFDVIDEIKSGLERACPGVVSCADILALTARDAVLQSGGPSWDVELGRRDGLKSSDFDAATHLPSSLSNAQTLITTFASNGLSTRDVVALSGAHTFGLDLPEDVAKELLSMESLFGYTIQKISKLPEIEEDESPRSGYGKFSFKGTNNRSSRGWRESNDARKSSSWGRSSYGQDNNWGYKGWRDGGNVRKSSSWGGRRYGQDNNGDSKGWEDNDVGKTSSWRKSSYSQDNNWLGVGQQRNRAFSTEDRNMSFRGSCFICGQSGHRAANCPSK